jgi:hypothetical protein
MRNPPTRLDIMQNVLNLMDSSIKTCRCTSVRTAYPLPYCRPCLKCGIYMHGRDDLTVHERCGNLQYCDPNRLNPVWDRTSRAEIEGQYVYEIFRLEATGHWWANLIEWIHEEEEGAIDYPDLLGPFITQNQAYTAADHQLWPCGHR